jgi:hypothetical protein
MRQMTEQDMVDIRTHFPLDACLPAPDLNLHPAAVQAFEALYQSTLSTGTASEVSYTLPYPKYLFLEYLVQQHTVMLHGSPLHDLQVLKPIRHTRDSREFGDQAAIYSTQDSLWAMFFALLNKSELQGPIMNGAIHLQSDEGDIIRRYFYCVDAGSLTRGPWHPGAIYIMPGDGFDADPDHQGATNGSYTMLCTHWLKRSEVQPLARLAVVPQDFPFLNQVWGYDLHVLQERMSGSSLAGWPFLTDPVLYPIRPDHLLDAKSE